MADAIITIPDITVPDMTNLEPAIPLLPNTPGHKGSYHKWSSVSVMASSANGTGKVWIGDSLVSQSRHSAVLSAGQSYSISGSAIDPSLIFVLGDGPLLVVFASGS